MNIHTKKQIEIGLDLLTSEENIEKENIAKTICETADHCLNQNEDWLNFYQDQMGNLDEKSLTVEKENQLKIKNLEKESIVHFINENYTEASLKIDCILKENLKENEKAKYFMLLANINYFLDKNKSNDFLLKAREHSHLSFQPFLSKEYLKSLVKSKAQITAALDYLNNFTTINDAISSIRETISNLKYSPLNKAEKFEEAIKELGSILGYISSRPEKEQKEGPDNLWIMNNNTCLVIESKSEKKDTNLIDKRDISQLLHSLTWFDNKYINKDLQIYGVTMQYNGKKDTLAETNEKIRVIDNKNLESIKSQLNKYIHFLSQRSNINNITEEELLTEFASYKFDTISFLGRYLKNLS